MTVTIQCRHCNQSLAVAPRRPGSRLECPACGQSVVFPAPSEQGKSLSAPANSQLAEATSPRAVESPGPLVGQRPKGALPTGERDLIRPSSMSAGLPVKAAPGQASDAPRQEPQAPRAYESGALNEIVIPRSTCVLILLFALLALGAAFVAGYFWGRSTPSPQSVRAAVEADSTAPNSGLAIGTGVFHHAI